MKTISLPFTERLRIHLKSPKNLIQVLLGPRQVGKTTTVLKMLEDEYAN